MTNDELNTALYEKMFAEQETYRAWLLSQPPEEILNHAYEYTMREDIWQTVEDRAKAEVQKHKKKDVKERHPLTTYEFPSYLFLSPLQTSI